jgi:nitroreductase
MEIKQEDVMTIISAGIKAPSADNSQPWKFRPDRNSIHVSYDTERVGMFFDSALTATYMSLGAVCENMRLQAGKLGYQVDVELHNASHEARNPVFTLHLTSAGASPSPLADAIATRMTNRFLYRRDMPIEASALTGIELSIERDTGCRVHWTSDGESRKKVMKAVMLADLVRFTQPQIHHDFHEKLHFGRDAITSRDGLAAATLGLEKPLLPLLRLLKPWPVSNALNRLGLHYIMAWRGGWLPMWAAGAIGVIVAQPETSCFAMGRALQRVWLAATHAGLAFQPFGALPLHFLRLRELAGAGLTEHHRRRLTQADACWRGAVNAPADQHLVMIFRLGHVIRVPEQSRRREESLFLQ